MSYTGASSFGVWAVNGIALGSTTQANFGGNATGTANTLAVGSNGGAFVTVDLKGALYATSGGTLAMYWAQNTSNATSTALRQGCYLRARQIA
jgi:autotransporter adhesin